MRISIAPSACRSGHDPGGWLVVALLVTQAVACAGPDPETHTRPAFVPQACNALELYPDLHPSEVRTWLLEQYAGDLTTEEATAAVAYAVASGCDL